MEMNHNKHNLMVGQVVILDANYQNKAEVGIHAFTPNEMYATVYAKNEIGGDMWQVMTNRLTPKSGCHLCGKLVKDFDEDFNNCCDECWLSQSRSCNWIPALKNRN